MIKRFNRWARGAGADMLTLDRRVLIALLGGVLVALLVALPALGAINHNGIICDAGESNCVESWYGGSIRVYSDGGVTQKFAVVGSNGNLSFAGSVTGKVLQYPAATGVAQVCDTVSITSTTYLAHAGISTPQVVVISAGQDATGDGARVTYVNSGATVQAKAWNSALTPAAATTPVAASYCIIGVP